MSVYKELSKEIVFFYQNIKVDFISEKKNPQVRSRYPDLEMWNPPNHWFPLYFKDFHDFNVFIDFDDFDDFHMHIWDAAQRSTAG